MDDVMSNLYHTYRIGTDRPGISHQEIRKTLVNIPGGRRLGSLLDSLVGERKTPDVHSAFKKLGMELVSEKKTNGAWIGLNLASSNGALKVRTHKSGSPCRDLIHTGDEIIAVDGLRVKTAPELSAAIYGLANKSSKFTIAREGILSEVIITPVENPGHLVNLDGKGNRIWDAIKATKQR